MKKEYFQKIYNVDTWLNIHIKQISYSKNLILTLAVAGLGFTINYFQKVKEFRYVLLLVAVIFLFSILCGIVAALLESENYNLYRKISRIIEKTEIDSKAEFDENIFKEERGQCDIIERKNVTFFKGQVWGFLIASFILSFLVFTS